MRSYTLALAAAISGVYAYEDCQDSYSKCIAGGKGETVCQCDLATCSGEDNARTRDYCSSATANLTTAAPTSTSIPQVAINCASPIAGTIVQPSGQPQVTACANSLKLGETCGADEQCQNSAQCWGSTAGTIRTCGNFNAACEHDDQCAFNTCNNGLCNGFLASSTSVTAPSTATATTGATGANTISSCPAPGSTDVQGRYSCNPAHTYPAGQTCQLVSGCYLLSSTTGSSNSTQGTARPSGYGNRENGTIGIQPSSSIVPYTGGATVMGAASGLGAFVAGLAAFVL